MGKSLSDMCHLAQTVISPGQAKNVLTVGSSKNVGDGTDRLSWFSGKGPTPDGRFKPDVVAVGEIFSAMSSKKIGDSVSDCHTEKMEGTSMATPIIAGTAALLRQYIEEGRLMDGINTNWVPSPFQPTAALLKALLMHGARQVLHQECRKWELKMGPFPHCRSQGIDVKKSFLCQDPYSSDPCVFPFDDFFLNFGATFKLLCVCVCVCLCVCVCIMIYVCIICKEYIVCIY
jgi:hypothetical protein